LRDGSDRLRDKKGKTVTGRAKDAAVMLSAFDESTAGLVLCEGVETGIAIFAAELRPVWACGAAGTLATFPFLGGIEALTIAADADAPGMQAAEGVAERWRQAGAEARIVAPPAGDWAGGV
jgi:putative DNA primase/helicase